MTEDANFADGEIERFYNETFIAKKTENSIPFGTSIFKDLLLRNTSTFLDKKDVMLALLGRKNNADSKLLNALISGMEAQIKSGFFNQFIYQNGIDITSMFTGKTSMAKRINNFKHQILKGNPKLSRFLNNDGTINNDFINYLIPNIDYNGLDFIDTSALLDADQSQANNLINYWRELIDDPEPKVSQLFKDLVVYAFITSGDNPTMNSFFQYVPNSYRISIGYTDYIQTKLDELSNGVDQSIVRDDLFLNNWQNDKLVRPVDLYNKKGVKLYSISLNDQSIVPNIIMGERQDKTDKPAIRPSNWIKMMDIDNEGQTKERSFPIFYPYIKINDGLGYTPANYHVYSLIGYKQAADPDTKRLNYIPIYGLVSKKGYKYRGHTVVEYGKESQFDFNRENVWDYTEALQNQEALADMSDEYSKPNWQNSDIHLITDLPPYQNMNYAKEQQDIVFEWNQDDKDESEQGVVLSEAEEDKDSYNKIYTTTQLAQEWSSKEGWSVEYFNKRVLPKINQAWQIEYELAPDQSITPKLKGSMNYSYEDNANSSIQSKTTLDAIKNGERTATTRYESDKNIEYWKQAKVGDIIEFHNKEGESVKVVVTKPLTKLTERISSIQLSLFPSESDVLQKVRDYLTELSKENSELSIDDKIEEFTQLLRKENPTTPEEVEGLINKFICNL